MKVRTINFIDYFFPLGNIQFYLEMLIINIKTTHLR